MGVYPNQREVLTFPFPGTCTWKIHKQNIPGEFLALPKVKEMFACFIIVYSNHTIFLLQGLSLLASAAAVQSFLWDPMGCSPPDSSSMEFSKQEYWSGLPCPPPRDLPDPGIEPRSAAFQADSLTLSHQGRPPLSLRTTKWPRDVAAHTKYTTIQKIIRASIPWGSPRISHIKKRKYQNLWERGMAQGPGTKDLIIQVRLKSTQLVVSVTTQKTLVKSFPSLSCFSSVCFLPGQGSFSDFKPIGHVGRITYLKTMHCFSKGQIFG